MFSVCYCWRIIRKESFLPLFQVFSLLQGCLHEGLGSLQAIKILAVLSVKTSMSIFWLCPWISAWFLFGLFQKPFLWFYISAMYESSNFHIRFSNPFKCLLFSLFFKSKLIYYFWLYLCCCTGFFLVALCGGYFLVVHRLLFAVASFIAERGL